MPSSLICGPTCVSPPSQIPDKANLLDGPVPILKLYLPDVPVLSRERYLPKYAHELFQVSHILFHITHPLPLVVGGTSGA